MAKVRVCDRCREKIPHTPSGMHMRVRAFKFRRFKILTETEYRYGEHDLCNICMGDFNEFMDGAKILREEETSDVR